MTDNLLQLIDLQADILLADLNDRTKRCAIVWNRVATTTYHCYFQWNNDWYDAYVTLMRGSYGFDLIKNGRNVFSINSYINNQVAVLYYVITDTFNNSEIKQIIQDVNSLVTCKNMLREAARGGVEVGGDAIDAYYRYVIGGVIVGGTGSLRVPSATFTNDGIAEYNGYSYSSFNDSSSLLTSGTIDCPMGFYYGPGSFDQGDPCSKFSSNTNFALLPPYVRINNYSGQVIPAFTPITATYQIVNGSPQSSVTQPTSSEVDVLGGSSPNNETVMLINIGSPNSVGYYKLFLNLMFGFHSGGDQKLITVRAYMGYSNNTSPTYMPTLVSDFIGLDLTTASATAISPGDCMTAIEISDVIGEVIAQEWWDTSYGIMLEVRHTPTVGETTIEVYNSLSPYTSPDVMEFPPTNFTTSSNTYIRFTMRQSGTADISTLSIVKGEAASSGITTIQIRAVKDPNIAWPTSEVDLDYEFTTASVSYTIDLSDEIGTQYDIEVTTIVQEVIDQVGWVAGNAIMFVLSDGALNRTWHVQQIVPEIFTPISIASEENGVYSHAELTFQRGFTSTGGVTLGGTGLVGEPSILYMGNASGTGSLELLRQGGTFETIKSNLKNIAAVQFDFGYGRVFFSQVELNGGRPSGTTLSSCDPDGSNVTTILNYSNYDAIRSFALDRSGRKIYFVIQKLYGSGSNLVYDVKRCDYDGSNIIDIVAGNSYICSPTSLDIDLDSGYIFWCDNHGIGEGYIHRSDLDGSNYTTILSTSGYVRAIAVHEDMLYLGGPGFLAKVNEQGSNEILLPHTGLSIINGISISATGQMYISDSGVKKVVETDLDGNNMQVLVDDAQARSAICLASGVV